ncbi:MAG: peptidase [Treponema sp.]|jgi:hypothetical protein|nr:peptidase [Treponema sp.]
MPRKATLLVVAAFTVSAFTACISAPDDKRGIRSHSPADSSRQSPVKVKPGEWIAKTLASNSADWFSFTPASAGILVAETQGDTDTLLDLYRGSELLRENDDVGKDCNAKIEYFVDPGVNYLIKASGVRLAGAAENASGPYRFRATLEPMPEKKAGPNNTMEQAETIALEETVTDYFFAAEDVNWYSVSVPGAGRLTIHTEGTLDTLLEVYDNWGELIGRDDDSGYQGNAKVTADVFSASPVYCRVNAYQGATGRYYLKTKFTPPAKPDSFEPDNIIAKAKDIEIGVPQARNFTDAGDVDWARLRIVRQGSYRIAATAQDNYLDTFIQLFDDAEQLLAEDDDSGGFWNALLKADLKPGTYYIQVSCLDKDPLENNEYTLSVSAEN